MFDLMTTDIVIDLIDDASDTIALRLESHPTAGKKFTSLNDSGREAWIAWTWLFDQLVERGLARRTAIELRAGFIAKQDELGTYNAIAACLNSLKHPRS